MKKDNFWKIFWSCISVFVLVGTLSIGWLKFLYLSAPEDESLALAIGVTFDPLKDPFERTKQEKKLGIISGYLYQDSIPFGFEDWSWNSTINWRENTDSPDGSYAVQAQFLTPWAGIRLRSPLVDIGNYKSISIEVKPDQNITDLYLDMYDTYGNTMGRQSLAWYMANATLIKGVWNTVHIPLSNLLDSKNGTNITGFSISSEKEGVAFIDSVRLETDAYDHPKWVDSGPQNSTWIGSDPFKNTEQINLPYIATFLENDLKSWKELFGLFEKKNDGVMIGPVPKSTNGSMAVFGGGGNWTNYMAKATVYWGMTSTFSLLARFENDSNFVSCAYSNYGSVVQIYLVKDGESTLISQTPGLAIVDYEPWKNVKHAIAVNGNEVSCYMSGEKVLSADLPNMPAHGTIGFETWSKNSNDFPHKVLSLDVEPL